MIDNYQGLVYRVLMLNTSILKIILREYYSDKKLLENWIKDISYPNDFS